MKTFLSRSLFFFTLVNLLLLASVAQQTPPSNPSAPQPAQTMPAQTMPAQPADQSKDPQNKKASDTTEGTSKDRLFYALPNF